MVALTPRPPRLRIPDEVITGGRLTSFMARLALARGSIFILASAPRNRSDRETVYLVGPEANRFVLFTHSEHFSHELGWTPVFGESLGSGLINMDGPEHQRDRATLNPAFTTSYMDRYLPLMNEVISARTRDWVQRGEVDLAQETREIAFDAAATALVGLQTGGEVDFLRGHFHALLGGTEPLRDNPDFSSGVAPSQAELNGRLLELIAARRKAVIRDPPENVLDMLIRASPGQAGLSDEQILGHVNILLVAGHETITTLSSWLLYFLALFPEYGARVDAELGTLPGGPDIPITTDAVRYLPVLMNAILETGRLQPPVMFIPRGVVREFEFDGYRVAAGARVLLAIAAGHRLPGIFENPDTFDPDRFSAPREEHKKHPYAIATFGGGPRTCLGGNFAEIEIKALVAHVRRRCRLTPVAGESPQAVEGIVQRLSKGIRVRVDTLI
jgi:retinoid hydroxylase